MRRKSLKIVTCCLAGALLTAVPVYEAEAAPSSQYTKTVKGGESDSSAPAAGVTLAVAGYLEDTKQTSSQSEASGKADTKASAEKETKKNTKNTAKTTKSSAETEDKTAGSSAKTENKKTAKAAKSAAKTENKKTAKAAKSANKTENKKTAKSAKTTKSAEKANTKTTKKKNAEKASKYDNMAVAKVDDYVNVRKAPNEDGELVGKLYSDSVAKVLKKKGNWYKIKSGSVTGYVNGDYIVVGDGDLVKSVGVDVATVNTMTLKVRSKASKKSDVITLVSDGEELTVASMKQYDDGWVKVKVEDEKGYVSADYVDISTQYNYAESKEEEEARLAAEQAEREREERANAQAQAASSESSAGSSSDSSVSTVSSTGQAVANYACQFLGNPYVWGGTSLTNGADCSGFVMSVYAHFGVSMPHSSYAQMGVGYGVSASSMQPGDIVCYGDHVAIYVGNNTIVHASNHKDGIKYTSPANYRSILAVRRVF